MSMRRGVIISAEGRAKYAWQWAFSNAEPCPMDLPVESGDRIWDCTILADAFVAAWDDDANPDTPVDALYSQAEREHHAFEDWQKNLHERTEDDLRAIVPAGVEPEVVPAIEPAMLLQPGFRRLCGTTEPSRPVRLVSLRHDDGHLETVRLFPRHRVLHVFDGGEADVPRRPEDLEPLRERRRQKVAFDRTMQAAVEAMTAPPEPPAAAEPGA